MNTYEELIKNRQKKLILFFALIIILILIFLLSLNMGAMKISLFDVFKILWAKITFNDNLLSQIKPNIYAVVWEIRLPRILCGIFVGAGLSVSGVIFQSILQNPLADPYTLGISTGASFGASLVIYINIVFDILLPVWPGALSFAFITLVVVILIAGSGHTLKSSELIISGIIVSSFFSAGISLLKMLSGENVGAIVFWLMGSLSAMTLRDVCLIYPVVIVCTAVSYFNAKKLNALTLGENNAKALGINTSLTRLIFIIIGALLTAFCVCICGIVGFVGLVIPHLLRLWLSTDNKVLIPFSALSGGILLCLADNITRIFTSGEIPVGIITTLIGGPFFIYIFIKRRRNF